LLTRFWKLVADYADLASVAGFVFSLIGFTWTIVSARAARRAAEQARESVARIRSQLLANELRTVIQCLRDLGQEIRKGKPSWERAIRFCEEARVQLLRNSRSMDFTAEEASRISAVIDDLEMLFRQLDETRSRKQEERQVPRNAYNKLNDAVTVIGRIEGRLTTPQAKEFES
jgi:hypothetical protein